MLEDLDQNERNRIASFGNWLAALFGSLTRLNALQAMRTPEDAIGGFLHINGLLNETPNLLTDIDRLTNEFFSHHIPNPINFLENSLIKRSLDEIKQGVPTEFADILIDYRIIGILLLADAQASQQASLLEKFHNDSEVFLRAWKLCHDDQIVIYKSRVCFKTSPGGGPTQL